MPLPLGHRVCFRKADHLALDLLPNRLRNPRGAAHVGRCVKNEAKIGDVIVGGQPDAADVASGRFKTIVNCRPADEDGNVTEALVQGTEVNYFHIPFTGETLAKKHIDQMRSVLDGAQGTTLVHCQGGTRAAVAVAIVLAERAGQRADDVVKALEAADFDIKDRPYEAFIAKYFA